jgi:hypothetical protein
MGKDNSPFGQPSGSFLYLVVLGYAGASLEPNTG